MRTLERLQNTLTRLEREYNSVLNSTYQYKDVNRLDPSQKLAIIARKIGRVKSAIGRIKHPMTRRNANLKPVKSSKPTASPKPVKETGESWARIITVIRSKTSQNEFDRNWHYMYRISAITHADGKRWRDIQLKSYANDRDKRIAAYRGIRGKLP